MLPEAVPLPLNVLYHSIDAFAIHFELKSYVKPVQHSRVNHDAGRWRCSLRASHMKENTSRTQPLHSMMSMEQKPTQICSKHCGFLSIAIRASFGASTTKPFWNIEPVMSSYVNNVQNGRIKNQKEIPDSATFLHRKTYFIFQPWLWLGEAPSVGWWQHTSSTTKIVQTNFWYVGPTAQGFTAPLPPAPQRRVWSR